MGGCSDDESSDDDRNHKEESSQQSDGCQEVTSAIKTEKHDVTTTDVNVGVAPTASQSPTSKPIRKRKVDAEMEEIDMKRMKFDDRPDERGIESVSSPLPGANRHTEVDEPVNYPSSPNRRSSANSDDRPQALLSGSFSQDSGEATPARIEQVVSSPDPHLEKFTSSESKQLSPPVEEILPSAENSISEESPRGKLMDADTSAKTSEMKATLTGKTDRDSHKMSFSCRSSIQDDNWQRAEEVPLVESQDSVVSPASSSRDVSQQTMRQVPNRRGVAPRERKQVTMCDKSTETDFPDAVTGKSVRIIESRRSREIAEGTRQYLKKIVDRLRPKDPRMSGRKRTEGNTGRSEERSISIQSEDIVTHNLLRSWTRLDRPGPSSAPECIGTYYHKDKSGNMHYYREYPGLSLQPFSVKKDATYQKRFYRENKSIIMPIKFGEIIQWGINLAKDLAGDIPRYSMSDEEKLSLDDYRALSQQLMQGFVTAYHSPRVKEGKNLRDRKKRRTEQRKSSYATSSFQEESPGDSSNDETIYSPSPPSPYRTSSLEDPILFTSLRARERAPPYGTSFLQGPILFIPPPARETGIFPLTPDVISLPMPDFSSQCNVSRGLPQSAYLQTSAPEVAGPSTSNLRRWLRNPDQHRVRMHGYESYLNLLGHFQSVLIKFVKEDSHRSKRLIYCRDNMSFASDEGSRMRLKPFFKVEEVLQLEEPCPSVSVEEFLQMLLEYQELYYQLLYDESERFYTVREHIYRCVIPMRKVKFDNNELDENNPKPSTSGSGQSSKSLDSSGEVSSTSETNIASQQQTRNNYPSGRQESLDDDGQPANKEDRFLQMAINFLSRYKTGLSGRTGEMSVNRSETRDSLSPFNSNLSGTATSENAEGEKFAVVPSLNEKWKHKIWYPPTAKEADEDVGFDYSSTLSETDSASE